MNTGLEILVDYIDSLPHHEAPHSLVGRVLSMQYNCFAACASNIGSGLVAIDNLVYDDCALISSMPGTSE